MNTTVPDFDTDAITVKNYFATSADSPGGTPVYVATPDGDVTELDPRLDLANHSPDGFSWGYAGSGPAQLALAILSDWRGTDYAIKHYQTLKRRLIATHPPEQAFRTDVNELRAVLDSPDQ